MVDLPRTQRVQMEAYDNVFSLYEMAQGGIGACHVGRIHHPVLPGFGGGGLQIFGTEGNLMGGAIISKRQDLLPQADADGWFRLPPRG